MEETNLEKKSSGKKNSKNKFKEEKNICVIIIKFGWFFYYQN